MAEILTETSDFSPDIVVPEPGDARTAASVKAPIQKLTNRTFYLNQRADSAESHIEDLEDASEEHGTKIDAHDAAIAIFSTVAAFSLSTSTTSGRVDLTEEYDQSPGGNFSETTNRVTVPSDGVYEISLSVQVKNNDTEDPNSIGAYLYADDLLLAEMVTGPVPASGFASQHCTVVFAVTDRNTQRLNVRLRGGTGLVASFNDVTRAGMLTIRKIAAPD